MVALVALPSSNWPAAAPPCPLCKVRLGAALGKTPASSSLPLLSRRHCAFAARASTAPVGSCLGHKTRSGVTESSAGVAPELRSVLSLLVPPASPEPRGGPT